MLFIICACGPKAPSEGEDIPAKESNNQVTSTNEIVADTDFSFRIDESISISFQDLPSEIGKVNIYSQYEHYDAFLDLYYPNNSSLLASYIASTDIGFPVQVNSTWSYLILEWLPMDGKSDETYVFLPLTDTARYVISF